MSEAIKPTVIVVMGVTGTGKSTVGALMARKLGWPFCEGDDLHPPENIAKMASGQPLNDADRQPWLDQVRAHIDRWSEAKQPGVMTCSALTRAYRNRLAADGVVFVSLQLDPAEISARLAERRDHFMPAALLGSQLAAFEPLGDDEPGVTVHAARSPDAVAEEAIRLVGC